MAGHIERRMITAEHRDGSLEFPLADIRGARDGPTVAIITGIHGGEYSGPLAAMRLVQRTDPDALAGRLLIVPVLSTQAFMMRTMSCRRSTSARCTTCGPVTPGHLLRGVDRPPVWRSQGFRLPARLALRRTGSSIGAIRGC